MRSAAADFHLVAASSVGEATAMLAAGPWRIFAGGTDLMVLFEAGTLAHQQWLSLWGITALSRIDVTDQHVELGCLVTYAQIQAHSVIRAEFPSLVRAAAETGSIAIQNRGTIGGNIANASPAADSPPPLLTYDASVKLVSAAGERWVPYGSFHLGYKQTALKPGDLLTAVRLPRRQPATAPNMTTSHYFRKVGARRAQAISKVVAAGFLQLAGDRVDTVRLAFGSVGPTTVRCPRTEHLLLGRQITTATIEQAVRESAQELAPIDDLRSTRRFRQTVAGNLLRECLSAALAGAHP